MITESFVGETAVMELYKKLPSLSKHNYNTIDKLLRAIAQKHEMNHDALNDLFVKKFNRSPDSWVKGKLDESDVECDLEQEVEKFVDWAAKKLNLQTTPKIELSMDTEEAQTNHHTGSHTDGDNSVWVYAKNRNLVDILRTVFHELVHVRQGELGMIKPHSSYPGSPIEVMADCLAGKYIKIYGEKNHHIFQ
jgi:rubrerythrin